MGGICGYGRKARVLMILLVVSVWVREVVGVTKVNSGVKLDFGECTGSAVAGCGCDVCRTAQGAPACSSSCDGGTKEVGACTERCVKSGIGGKECDRECRLGVARSCERCWAAGGSCPSGCMAPACWVCSRLGASCSGCKGVVPAYTSFWRLVSVSQCWLCDAGLPGYCSANCAKR